MESSTETHTSAPVGTKRIIIDSHRGPIEEHPLVLSALQKFQARIVPAIPGENEAVSSPDSINLPVAPLTVRRLQAHQAQEAESLLEWGKTNLNPSVTRPPFFEKKKNDTPPSQLLFLPISPLPSPAQKVSEPFKESPLAGPDDATRVFLEELAEGYEHDEKYADAGITRAIKVHEDYLLLGECRLKRKNETGNIDEWETDDFTFEKAIQHFDKMPTQEEWKKILESIPGEKPAEKVENFLSIFFGVGRFQQDTHGFYPPIDFWVQEKSTITSTRRKKRGPRYISMRLNIGRIGAHDNDFFRFVQTGGNKKHMCYIRLLVK